MGRKGGGNILMAFGVVLALISGAAVFFVVQLNVAKGKEIPERPVVVALVDIPERTVITPDKVTVQQWPENIIPPGAIAKVEGVSGKFAKGKLLAKVAILDSQIAGIATEGAEKGPATTAPAPGKSVQVPPEFNPNLIEKGKVLVAVTYPSAVPLIKAGAVFPGSRVDIIVEAPGLLGPQIAPVFRNIEVKFIGSVTSTTEAGATKVDSVLVFAVPPQEAIVLTFIESMKPRLLLRAAGDNENPTTDLVTTEYLSSRFGLQRPSSGGSGGGNR